VGDPADLVAILLEGECQVFRGSGPDGQPIPVARLRPGEPIGDVAYFADHNRRAEVRAEGQPVQLLVFTTERFESLLQTSPEFSRSLLRQLALRIEDLYGKLAQASTHQLVGVPRVQESAAMGGSLSVQPWRRARSA
jgi:CRP-like cAMP-binding protein